MAFLPGGNHPEHNPAPTPMLANIILLVVVFGATKWKKQPYLGALIFALVKGGLYFAVPLQSLPLWACMLNGAIGFLLFGSLAAGFVYFLRRLDRGETKEVSYSTRGSDRVTFKWEYLPLVALLLAIIFGEMLINALFRGAGG
jgi:hypothetical protein